MTADIIDFMDYLRKHRATTDRLFDDEALESLQLITFDTSEDWSWLEALEGESDEPA